MAAWHDQFTLLVARVISEPLSGTESWPDNRGQIQFLIRRHDVKLHHVEIPSSSNTIKELHSLVDRVKRLPNSKLSKVCGEIVSSMHSPARVIPGWSTCVITECQAQNCIDVSRATKQNQSIPVHAKFQYFVLMCFYCCRIEHVIRSVLLADLQRFSLSLTLCISMTAEHTPRYGSRASHPMPT
jgi:hypothetical protein